LILSFLNSEAKLSTYSQAIFASKLFPSHLNYSQDVPRHIRGVHVSVYFGLEEIIKSLPKRSKSPDLKDSYGRIALSYAAENGHKMLVKLLLATSKVDANT
jgi:ankyrin repeat protein